jgi:hypothetical protein
MPTNKIIRSIVTLAIFGKDSEIPKFNEHQSPATPSYLQALSTVELI